MQTFEMCFEHFFNYISVLLLFFDLFLKSNQLKIGI